MGRFSDILSDWRAYRREASRVNVTDPWLLIRYFSVWRQSLRSDANPIADRRPWMTFPAIDALKLKLKERSRVFEYGAGGSTLFFLDLGVELISVDHDSAWLEQVSKKIDGGAGQRWQKYLAVPEPDPDATNKAFDDPDGYVSQDASLSGFTLENYVQAIDRFSDDYFDVVVVDGRARPSCAKHARPKVKPGGWLVLDNAERDYYWWIGSDLTKAGWKEIKYQAPGPYNRYFWMTSIYQRPENE